MGDSKMRWTISISAMMQNQAPYRVRTIYRRGAERTEITQRKNSVPPRRALRLGGERVIHQRSIGLALALLLACFSIPPLGSYRGFGQASQKTSAQAAQTEKIDAYITQQ